LSEVVRRKVCKCENCGNEAEMVVTCSLEEDAPAEAAPIVPIEPAKKIKGTAACTQCGNEAEMWVDL